MEIFEKREELEDIDNPNDAATFLQSINQTISDIQCSLNECFQKEDLHGATDLVVRLKYYEKVKGSFNVDEIMACYRYIYVCCSPIWLLSTSPTSRL